ncbi:MAG: hypothetical protein FJX29_02855, partial [Alphaproteobacteria bacterium]|nr:hypothetical protein [Alphaproteobacteria bacterium]
AAANATRPGMLGSMSKGGFMAGLLGAGALGLLLGYGLSGGLGGLASILGLLLQIGLFALLAMLVIGWWRSRNQQQPAQGSQFRPGNQGQGPGMGFDRQGQHPGQQPGQNSGAQNAGMMGGAAGGMFAQQAQAEVPTRPLNLTGDDFSAFERILVDIHAAFAREDEGALRQLGTEEMFSYFAEDVRANIEQGRALKISGVRLEQGDLAEAWKEPDAEYATVAMRFSLTDAVVERASGRVIEGSLTEPREVTEIWTFVRRPGGKPHDWVISAIQDAAEADEVTGQGQHGSDGRA